MAPEQPTQDSDSGSDTDINTESPEYKARSVAFENLRSTVTRIAIDAYLLDDEDAGPCRSGEITHVSVGKVRHTALKLLDAEGNTLPLVRVPNVDGPFERFKRACISPGDGSWTSMTIRFTIDEEEVVTNLDINYEEQVYTNDERTKPDADDWALEFAFYPRDTLPDWATALIATAKPVGNVIPRQRDVSSDLHDLRMLAEETSMTALVRNHRFNDKLDILLGDFDYNITFSAGEITFTSRSTGNKIMKKCSLVGSVSAGAGTWLWGWGHPMGDATGPIAALKAYGEQEDLADLSNAELALDFDSAELGINGLTSRETYYEQVANLAGIAAVHVLGGGVYRVIDMGGGTHSVLHIADITDDDLDPFVIFYFSINTEKLEKLPGVNNRRAVIYYAEQAGLPLSGSRVDGNWRLLLEMEEYGQVKDVPVWFTPEDRIFACNMDP